MTHHHKPNLTLNLRNLLPATSAQTTKKHQYLSPARSQFAPLRHSPRQNGAAGSGTPSPPANVSLSSGSASSPQRTLTRVPRHPASPYTSAQKSETIGYFTGHSEQQTPAANSHEQPARLLMSAGSALTTSLRAIHTEPQQPHAASQASIATAQPSVCTTPAGHLGLSAISLHRETDETQLRHRLQTSKQQEEQGPFQALHSHRDDIRPGSFRAGRNSLQRSSAQVLSHGGFTEGSPVSSTTTTSPPRAIILNTEPQRGRMITMTTQPEQPLHSARSGASGGPPTDRQNYHWLAYQQKFEKNFGRNPYLHSAYIDQIIQRMDQKFETLGTMTRDFEDNACDLLLFKNKLYRVISDVQNDLRESANIIHILTQDRIRLKELFCRTGAELERAREQLAELKEIHKRLYEQKTKLESRAQAYSSELAFYKNESGRLRALATESEAEIDRLKAVIAELRGEAGQTPLYGSMREDHKSGYESHHRAYSTLGLPGGKHSSTNSALELLGSLNSFRSRSYQPLDAAGGAAGTGPGLTHRSGFSNYSLAEYEQEPLGRALAAGKVVRDLLMLLKGNERDSRYRRLLGQKFQDLDDLQQALQECAEREDQGNQGLLSILSVLIGLIKKAETSKPPQQAPPPKKAAVTIGTSPLKLPPLRQSSPENSNRAPSQEVRSSIQSLNWESPFHTVQEQEERKRQSGHIKRVSVLSQDPSKSKAADSQYGTVSSQETVGGNTRSTIMQLSLCELKELVKKEVMAEINLQKAAQNEGEVSFHSSMNFDSAQPDSAPKSKEAAVSQDQSETAIVTFPPDATGTKSLKSLMGESGEKFFRQTPEPESAGRGLPRGGRMLYVEYQEFNPALLTATGGLDTPDYGENKAKMGGIDYDSLGSLDSGSGLLGARLRSNQHFKQEVSVISEKSESLSQVPQPEFNSLSNSNFVAPPRETPPPPDDSLFTLSHSQVTPKAPPTQKQQHRTHYFDTQSNATPSQISETVVKNIDFGGEPAKLHMDDSPEPIEPDSANATMLLPHLAQRSFQQSGAPSQASRIDDAYEAHMLAVRLSTSPPPAKRNSYGGYPSVQNIDRAMPEDLPSRVLRPEMLLTEQFEPGSEGGSLSPSPPRTHPASANATAAFYETAKAEITTPERREPMALMEKYASNQKDQYSRISDDLLRDLKKEEWPTNLLDKTHQDSFSEEASFSRGSFVLAQSSRVFRTPEVPADCTLSSVLAVTAGKYQDEIIEEGAEEEEAGTPLRVRAGRISQFEAPEDQRQSVSTTETRKEQRRVEKVFGRLVSQEEEEDTTALAAYASIEQIEDPGKELLSIKQRLQSKKEQDTLVSEGLSEEDSQLLFREDRLPFMHEKRVSRANHRPQIHHFASEDHARTPPRPQDMALLTSAKPLFFKFESKGRGAGGGAEEVTPTRDSKIPKPASKISGRKSERSLSSQTSSAIGARLSMSRSPFSRSHNIDGHSSVQRGSTAVALETDSDFSSESGCAAIRKPAGGAATTSFHQYSSYAVEYGPSGMGSRRVSRESSRKQLKAGMYASEAASAEVRLTGLESVKHKTSTRVAAMWEQQREREEATLQQQSAYQHTQPRVDSKWTRREDPHFKLRRSVKHVIDPNRKSTPDLSAVTSRVDTGIRKLPATTVNSGIATPRDTTPTRKLSLGGGTAAIQTSVRQLEVAQVEAAVVAYARKQAGIEESGADERPMSRNWHLVGSKTQDGNFGQKKHSLGGSTLSSARNKTPTKLRTPTAIRKSFMGSTNENSSMLVEKKKARSNMTTPRGAPVGGSRASTTTTAAAAASKGRREPFKQRKTSKI